MNNKERGENRNKINIQHPERLPCFIFKEHLSFLNIRLVKLFFSYRVSYPQEHVVEKLQLLTDKFSHFCGGSHLSSICHYSKKLQMHISFEGLPVVNPICIYVVFYQTSNQKVHSCGEFFFKKNQISIHLPLHTHKQIP